MLHVGLKATTRLLTPVSPVSSGSGVRETLRTAMTSANVAEGIQQQLLHIRDANRRLHRERQGPTLLPQRPTSPSVHKGAGNSGCPATGAFAAYDRALGGGCGEGAQLTQPPLGWGGDEPEAVHQRTLRGRALY